MLRIGSVLENRYRIEKTLGEGGNSTVYGAVQLRTGRELAVKEISKVMGDDSVEKRLSLLKNLHHSGLPMILDILESEDSFLIVMEYIAGKTLKEEMERRRIVGDSFSLDEIISIGSGLCEILSYLHKLSEPLLYRDIKPSNIMLRPDGSIALVDMGTICSVQVAVAGLEISMGTLGYAAPEQCRKEKGQGPETDIYSVGAVLHYTITGIDPAQTPFYFHKISKAVPERFRDYRGIQKRKFLGLERIIDICVSYRAEKRYHRVDELLEDLKNPEDIYYCGLSGKIRLFLPIPFIILAILFFILALRSDFLAEEIREEGKNYCLMKAQRVEGRQVDQWIEKALQFVPGDAYCFSVMLDRMLADGVFSEGEQIRVRELLDQRAEGEILDHEELLQRDPEACFRFSYRMGVACLYAADGIPDYIAAGNWFKAVISLEKEWKTESAGVEEEKLLLLKRTEIMEKICCYRWQVLSGNIQDNQFITLSGYWENLTELLEEDIPAGNLLVSELGLWKEILGILSDWPSELRGRGISWEQQAQAVNKISKLSSLLLNSREAEEYPAVKEQLKQLKEMTESVTEKRILLEEAEKKEKRSQKYGE